VLKLSNLKNISMESLCIFTDQEILHALHTINKGGFGFGVIIDQKDKTFVGIVTDGDIRRALIAGNGLDSCITSVNRPVSVFAYETETRESILSKFTDGISAIPLLNEKKIPVDVAIFKSTAHIPVSEPIFGMKELIYVNDCIMSGWVSSAGSYITLFEKKFADFCDTTYAISTSNGTTALHLALLALDISEDDEVIVPDLTFIATANAVTYTGAKPVFADIDEETWNISPESILQNITEKTKAIIVVHLYGHPADMDPILEIARKYNLHVIEDAAEAHGAQYKNKMVGGIGIIGIFSFYGNKIITTGEGGMIVTNSREIAEKVSILRDHGMDKKQRYWHPVLGYNYRMTNLQAALGVAQLERINEIIAKKIHIAKLYSRELKDISDMRKAPCKEWAKNVYWMYSILLDNEKKREPFISFMEKNGIDLRPFFPALHFQPIYKDISCECPISSYISQVGVNLPSSPNLKEEEIIIICNLIKDFEKQTSV